MLWYCFIWCFMYAVFDTATALINGVGKEIGEPYIRDNIECAAKHIVATELSSHKPGVNGEMIDIKPNTKVSRTKQTDIILI